MKLKSKAFVGIKNLTNSQSCKNEVLKRPEPDCGTKVVNTKDPANTDVNTKISNNSKPVETKETVTVASPANTTPTPLANNPVTNISSSASTEKSVEKSVKSTSPKLVVKKEIVAVRRSSSILPKVTEHKETIISPSLSVIPPTPINTTPTTESVEPVNVSNTKNFWSKKIENMKTKN